MPLEAPWKQGQVERAGGLWKQLMAKGDPREPNPRTTQDMITAASIVTQIRNAHPRANGYAPNQKLLLHFSGKVLVRSAHVHDRRHFDLFVASWLWNFGL